MHKLWHYRLCPLSRAVRLALTEGGVPFTLINEQPWAVSQSLLSINPAGELPVLELADGPVLCGAYAISEFVAEDGSHDAAETPAPMRPLALFPGGREGRAEVRRLVDWFNGKMHREVTRELLYEKVYQRMCPTGASAPDLDILRHLRGNLRYHLSYIGFLAYQRRWLAGDMMSFADLAAAAQLSVLDYLGEVNWAEHATTKDWYMRLKSRPALRLLLTERVPGTPPPVHYTNLDF